MPGDRHVYLESCTISSISTGHAWGIPKGGGGGWGGGSGMFKLRFDWYISTFDLIFQFIKSFRNLDFFCEATKILS